MPGIDFEVIRREVTMQQVLDLLDFQPVSRTGDQLRGPCPVHESSSPGSRSFSVNLSQNRYYCHKCGSKGHPLELWAAVNDLPIFEAAKDLCQTLHRDVPWLNQS